MTSISTVAMDSRKQPDASRGLSSSLNRESMRPVSASSQSAAAGDMPAENRGRYEQVFRRECQGKPYLTGIEAAVIFLDSRLHKHVLSNIWEQADVTRDGRFSCDEFCFAMWLIEEEKRNYPTMPQHQYPAHEAPMQQSANSWAQPPAYSQQPHQNLQSNHFQYQGPPPAGPPPPATVAGTALPGYSSYMPQTIGKRVMLEPMICQGCDLGLVSGDIVYCCEQCKEGVSSFCDSCHLGGKRCHHMVTPTKLEPAKDLKNEDKDGDFGFGLKCDGCKAKLKQSMLCWHCKRCFDPNFCQDCWKRKDKRCKHAAQGNVQLRRVGKSSVTAGQVLDGLGAVGSILGS